MESQPQNPEFRINPDNFLICKCIVIQLHYISICIVGDDEKQPLIWKF